MNEAKLKGVCVGAGYFSRFQYDSWNRIPEVEIVANCNRSVEKGAAMAADFGIPQTYGIDRFAAMLDKQRPDFVDIITPPDTHTGLCRAAVDAGVAIICQKPLAPTWEETRSLVDLLDASGLRCMVHENWRWQPWYREIKRLLDDGTIGEVFHCAVLNRMGDGWGEDAYLARQPFFRDYPRLLIFENGVHFLDTFRFLFGEVTSIFATTAQRNPVIKGEDSALVVCRHDNGITSLLDANRYNECEAADPRYTFGSVRIDGSQGHLELGFDGRIFIKPLGAERREHPYAPARNGFAGDCVHAVQQHFVDAMINEKAFESTPRDYLNSVRLVEAAYDSAASGEATAIN